MNRVTLRQRILDDLVAGVLQPDAKLTIDELARRYGASHMPVREALRELSGAGVLEIGSGRTARIRRMDRVFVENLFAARGPLETMMARHAASACTAADVAHLRAVEQTRLAAVGRQDYAAALAENHRFHGMVNAIAANREAELVLDRHRILLSALWRRVGYGAERFAGVANDHEHLLAALEARHADDAGTLMGAHVVKAKQDLLIRLERPAAGRCDA